jgi:hypothetical protein
MKEPIKYIVYGSKYLTPYIAATMARFHYTDLNQLKNFILWQIPDRGKYMKLSAGQSKVIEALYKKETFNEQEYLKSIRTS